MRAGQELCNDPVLARHYGEATDLSETSIVGLIGRASENHGRCIVQLDRYGRLIVEVDLGTADRFSACAQGR
jgi:hypothetical protein